jgi:hypothetical protein
MLFNSLIKIHHKHFLYTFGKEFYNGYYLNYNKLDLIMYVSQCICV